MSKDQLFDKNGTPTTNNYGYLLITSPRYKYEDHERYYSKMTKDQQIKYVSKLGEMVDLNELISNNKVPDEAIEKLVEFFKFKGIEIHNQNLIKTDNIGIPPLMNALKYKRIKVAEIMVKYFIARDNLSETPYEDETPYEEKDLPKLYQSDTALSYALKYRVEPVATILIDHFIKTDNTQLTRKYFVEKTLLMYAIQYGLIDIANKLIDHFIKNGNTDQFTVKNSMGASVLDFAERPKTLYDQLIAGELNAGEDPFEYNDQITVLEDFTGLEQDELENIQNSQKIDDLTKKLNSLEEIKNKIKQNMNSTIQSSTGGKRTITQNNRKPRTHRKKRITLKKRKHIKTKNTKSMKRRRITKKTI